MNNFEKDINHSKNKFAGKAKEVAGKISGNEQLELKGKIQSSKADLKKKVNVKNKVEDIKEDIAEKLNDRIDKNKKRKK